MSQFNTVVAILVSLGTLVFLFQKKVCASKLWRATVTPLASIIGSGFLVSAPLLIESVGIYAPIVMLIIIFIAYGLGVLMRFNIRVVEPVEDRFIPPVGINFFEKCSDIALAIAYIISITFYLKLLSAFFLEAIGHKDWLYENIFTTAMLLYIGIVGAYKGFSSLENLELYAVQTKLAIIAATLVTLFLYNAELFFLDYWFIVPQKGGSLIEDAQKVLGMFIIIQGFETSRYLYSEYTTKVRVKSMHNAQVISGIIYFLFVVVSLALVHDLGVISETTAIDLCKKASPVLAVLLVVAAIMSQFSASIADTVASAGLFVEASKKRVTMRLSYVVISCFAILLCWLVNIYQVITIASKAFALYYALQVLVSIVGLKERKKEPYRLGKFFLAFFLLVILFFVIFFSIPVKSV